MIRFIVYIVFSVTVIKTYAYESAASDAQIKFAIENKYDDTGPGAKEPDYAYKTYKTLDQALIAYLNDPDTKLPEHERMKAIQRLGLLNKVHSFIGNPNSYQNTPLDNFNSVYVQRPTPVLHGIHKDLDSKFLTKLPSQMHFIGNNEETPILYAAGGPEIKQPIPKQFINYDLKKAKEDPLRYVKVVKSNPVRLSHYKKHQIQSNDLNPKYSYSYGVNHPNLSDSKQFQGTREGDTVFGQYSYVDPNGHRRTVIYSSNGRSGSA